MERIKFKLDGLDCANCALKLEAKISGIKGVKQASINFATNKGFVEVEAEAEAVKSEIIKIAKKFEDGVAVEFEKSHHHDHEEGCSCGHDHHHDHEESCSCGHDHHHEHEEGCSCGHDHHHEHEESCSCGNEHHHEHEESCSCGHDHHHDHEESCSCGHDHHHDHEESCSCGHDHHHEHGEGCSCGHDHHHEHGEGCSCGHDHHHDHEESCSCGHDHHHEHEESCSCGHGHHHEHEESCSCGHDHHHEHEEGCSCGHDHHHEHEEGCSCGHDHHHHHEKVEPIKNPVGKQRWGIQGLDCANCALKVEAAVQQVAGVKTATLDFARNTLFFDLEKNVDEKQVKNAMKAAILKIEPVEIIEETKQQREIKRKNKIDIKKVICLGLALILLFVTDNPILMIVAYLLAGFSVLKKAIRNIMNGELFDENFLMSIATLGALFLRDYKEAIAVMIFYEVGEFFQAMAVNSSRESISQLMDLKSEVAHLEVNGITRDVDPETLKVNDIVQVYPGEKVPADGVLLSESAHLDTSALTGESMPASLKKDAEILSGCVNLQQVITVKITKPLEESTVAKVLELVENCSSKKAVTEQKITKFAKVYTPIVVVLAIMVAIVTPLFFNVEVSEGIRRACTFLVISCPCALVLSVPLGYFAGIGSASKKGILIKGGSVLEALKELDVIYFDKTGTLTTGEFKVNEITGENQAEVLEMAAYAEYYSSHPIAKSILNAYGKKIDVKRISDLQEIGGHGIYCKVDGKEVLAGNGKLMKKYNISYPNESVDQTCVYVAVEGVYSGSILIGDEIKPSSKLAIPELRKLGKQVILLSGDQDASVQRVAKECGVDQAYSQLLPQDKVVKVEEGIRSGKKCGFVGDGINDAPVLSMSHVGFSMGGVGSDAAIEASDVVLMKDDCTGIVNAIKVAKTTSAILNQNIVFVLAVKIIVMILGAFGYANMWMGVFADVGVALIAVLNTMRILRK